MNKNSAMRRAAGSLDSVASRGTYDVQDRPGHLVTGDGRNAFVSMAVEEIFLEGENATVLHHEPGSAHASELLETSGIWRIQLADD
jgi:hypothetical protein